MKVMSFVMVKNAVSVTKTNLGDSNVLLASVVARRDHVWWWLRIASTLFATKNRSPHVKAERLVQIAASRKTTRQLRNVLLVNAVALTD